MSWKEMVVIGVALVLAYFGFKAFARNRAVGTGPSQPAPPPAAQAQPGANTDLQQAQGWAQFGVGLAGALTNIGTSIAGAAGGSGGSSPSGDDQSYDYSGDFDY